jgi:hypothetical protein
LNSTLAEARSMIATEPPTDAAAILAPSGASASAMIGVGPVSIVARTAPSGLRMRTAPSAPAAAISP